MQPLYSVDHESRQNSYRAEQHSPSPGEDTPLLHRFPQGSNGGDRNLFMSIAVSLLLIVLITGVIIGIYLLVLQSNSENVLPPVETPLQLVSRRQWDPAGSPRSALPMTQLKAKRVIIVQTDTDQCYTSYRCSELLRSMQSNVTSGNQLPYNFLVSSDGLTFEALGWHTPSPIFSEYPLSLVLAFIGNFTDVQPTSVQIDEAKNFFAESVSQQHLDPSYVVFGKNTTYSPKALFKALSTLPRWNSELSDL